MLLSINLGKNEITLLLSVIHKRQLVHSIKRLTTISLMAMKILLSIFALIFSCLFTQAQHPTGKIMGPTALSSNIYPGTLRNYWVYVPQQYVSSSPACLLVVLDGLSRATGWKLPQVMDSLIAINQMPVTIGVFVDPGTVKASREGAYPRFNRSFEYDGMGDLYARFLIDELLPAIKKDYNLREDPDSHAVAGASSGAIAAFNVAWERPDQFRRVLSTIGTYVGLRGGDQFSTLVRKTEAKPIRVFLEDGSNDLNIYAGDWWTANQSMLAALTYAGYEVNHRWGNGGHDSKHAAAIMGEAMAWLWEGYPAAVATHRGVKPRLDLLIDGESWQPVDIGSAAAHRLTVDTNGAVLFTDRGSAFRVAPNHKIEKLPANGIDLIAAGASERFAWIKSSRKLVSISPTGQQKTLATHCDVDNLYAASHGLYISDSQSKRIGYYDFEKKTLRYYPTTFIPGAMALSAEKTFLNVASKDTPFGHSFKVNADGSLQDGQPYVHYQLSYGKTTPGIGGVDVDSENVLYSASHLGVQVSDQLGRVNFIFSKPASSVDDVKLSGDLLYVCAEGKLFVRRIAARGLRSFDAAVTPPKPQL